MADILVSRDQLQQARSLLEQLIEDCQDLPLLKQRTPNSRFARRMLARQRFKLADLLKKLGEEEAAQEQIRKAAEMRGKKRN